MRQHLVPYFLFCSDTICRISTDGKNPVVLLLHNHNNIFFITSGKHLQKRNLQKQIPPNRFLLAHIWVCVTTEGMNKAGIKMRKNLTMLLTFTLCSAYKTSERAKVFNNAKHVLYECLWHRAMQFKVYETWLLSTSVYH